MPPLTLVQKRALLAAMNNAQKAERRYIQAVNAYHNANSRERREEGNSVSKAARNWQEARELVNRLEKKLGLGLNANYSKMELDIISNLLTKHLPLQKHKRWLKGLEAEMERARRNFRNFAKGVFHQKINLIGESHRKKTPSPPKRVSPPRRTSPPPANNAHRRVHGIGPANNKRITWSRNANGKISIHKTLEKISLKLTNAQKNALSQMSENQAMNTIRQLARQR
jgi:hypothetical protein